MFFCLSPFAPENLVSRNGLGRPVPRQPAHLHIQAEYGAYLAGFLPSSAGASIYILKPPCPKGSVPRLSGHAIAYRWRSLPRTRRHSASSPKDCPSNGCCLCRSPWTNQCALLFSHTHYWYEVGMLKCRRQMLQVDHIFRVVILILNIFSIPHYK